MNSSFSIAGVPLGGKLLLAPMAGVTDFPFRMLCREQGCPLAYTEMVSAKGFLLAPQGNRAYTELLHTTPKEAPLALQIFGSEPALMAQAADRLTAKGTFALLDINMGCPAPKIANAGEGSALTRNPRLAEEIARAVVRGAHVPVTVKIRKGWDEQSETYLELGQRLQDAGVAAITLHGRTRRQFYEGTADWESIARLKEKLSIPLIGNGDVHSLDDAARMQAQTGCDAVMVGRGAMGNPWIFGGITPTPAQRIAMILRHLQMLIDYKGEGIALREMRKHIAWYVRSLKGAAKLRAQVNQISQRAALEETLYAFLAAQAPQENE